jgi:hypothetical protein
MSAELKKTKKLVKMLEGQGAIVVPYVGNVRQKNAFPDRLIYHTRARVRVAIRGSGTAACSRLLRVRPQHDDTDCDSTSNARRTNCYAVR